MRTAHIDSTFDLFKFTFLGALVPTILFFIPLYLFITRDKSIPFMNAKKLFLRHSYFSSHEGQIEMAADDLYSHWREQIKAGINVGMYFDMSEPAESDNSLAAFIFGLVEAEIPLNDTQEEYYDEKIYNIHVEITKKGKLTSKANRMLGKLAHDVQRNAFALHSIGAL